MPITQRLAQKSLPLKTPTIPAMEGAHAPAQFTISGVRMDPRSGVPASRWLEALPEGTRREDVTGRSYEDILVDAIGRTAETPTAVTGEGRVTPERVWEALNS